MVPKSSMLQQPHYVRHGLISNGNFQITYSASCQKPESIPLRELESQWRLRRDFNFNMQEMEWVPKNVGSGGKEPRGEGGRRRLLLVPES